MREEFRKRGSGRRGGFSEKEGSVGNEGSLGIGGIPWRLGGFVRRCRFCEESESVLRREHFLR